jgi:hypothetical protein
VDRGLEGDGKAQGCLHPSTGFVFQDGQISACWHNVDDVRLHLFGWWVDRHVGIRAIDESNRVVRFDRTARLRMEWPGGGGIDFVVENVFEALTEPGEADPIRTVRSAGYSLDTSLAGEGACLSPVF